MPTFPLLPALGPPYNNQMSAALQKPSVRATARERSRRSSPNGREAREQRSELVKGFLVGAVRGRRRCPRCERRPGRHGVLPFCPEAKPGRKLSTVRGQKTRRSRVRSAVAQSARLRPSYVLSGIAGSRGTLPRSVSSAAWADPADTRGCRKVSDAQRVQVWAGQSAALARAEPAGDVVTSPRPCCPFGRALTGAGSHSASQGCRLQTGRSCAGSLAICSTDVRRR